MAESKEKRSPEEDRRLADLLRGDLSVYDDAPPVVASVPSRDTQILTDAPEIEAELVSLLLNSSSVDIVGIAPRPLLAAVGSLASGASGATIPPLRYFTPAPRTLSTEPTRTVLGPTIQPWNFALKSLATVTGSTRGESDQESAPERHFVRRIGTPYVECLVRFRKPSAPAQVVGLSRLPATRHTGDPGDTVYWSCPATDEKLSIVIEELVSESSPLFIRQVLCKPLDPSDIPTEPIDGRSPFDIDRLETYGGDPSSSLSPALMPVAVISVRGLRPNGTSVIYLKRRTVSTDTSDAGMLSLPSARLIDEDLAAAFPATPSDSISPEEALDSLWLAAGSPSPFRIPQSAFLRAAQRELYRTCGLDVAANRLHFCGYQVVPMEKSPITLGFAVFDLVLKRMAGYDEARSVTTWTPRSMVRVDLDRLYSRAYGPLPLNRLLGTRPEWLQDNVFSRTMTPQEA